VALIAQVVATLAQGGQQALFVLSLRKIVKGLAMGSGVGELLRLLLLRQLLLLHQLLFLHQLLLLAVEHLHHLLLLVFNVGMKMVTR
jgi:hypothetical protein